MTLPNGPAPRSDGILAYAGPAFRKTLRWVCARRHSPASPRPTSLPRLSASETIMLERNRLQPPRPSAPSQTNGWSDGPSSYSSSYSSSSHSPPSHSPSSHSPSWDGPAGACSGLFASAEDYDATGILTGVDPSESCYWWMPELYTRAPAQSPAQVPAAIAAESAGVTDSMERRSGIRSGLTERLLRAGQATRRSGSRATAAA